MRTFGQRGKRDALSRNRRDETPEKESRDDNKGRKNRATSRRQERREDPKRKGSYRPQESDEEYDSQY